ncbi:defense/immunity protein [Lithospermum erythrorhizon]|uniref:Defense/immunity protein n=1 Tax=Lithospermum erythrorhizon TaxID=34254 RepID=A0AAV3QT83_LITER
MTKFIPLLAIISLTIFCKVAGRRIPPTRSPAVAATPQASTIQDYLDAHNKARTEVKVPPMKWSNDLAKAASMQVRYQRDYKNCSFANLESSQYGGNQLWASGYKVTPQIVVESWVAEKKFYKYADNSCAPNHGCGVYTQIVWKDSTELGCAQGICTKNQSSLTICYYNPPGNFVGEKPY